MSQTGIYLEVNVLKDLFNKDNWPGDRERNVSYDSEIVQDMINTLLSCCETLFISFAPVLEGSSAVRML